MSIGAVMGVESVPAKNKFLTCIGVGIDTHHVSDRERVLALLFSRAIDACTVSKAIVASLLGCFLFLR